MFFFCRTLVLFLLAAPLLAMATRLTPKATVGGSCPLGSHPRSKKSGAARKALLLAKGAKQTKAPGDIIETYKYSGCHLLLNEDKKTKPEASPSKRMMTIHKCFTACKDSDHKYFTLQKGNECRCLPYVDKDELKTDDSRCDQPCSGDAAGDEMCGGIENDSVYVMIDCVEQEPTEAEKIAAEQQEKTLSAAK